MRKLFHYLTHQILILCLCSQSLWANESLLNEGQEIADRLRQEITNPNYSQLTGLTSREKDILKNIGLSDSEVSALNVNDQSSLQVVKDKGQDYLQSKVNAAEKMLRKDAVPGMMSSIIATAFSAFLGITLVVECRNMPSAVMFAGSSAFWIASEMMNWNAYKLEIDKLSQLGQLKDEDLEKANALMAEINALTNQLNTIRKNLGNRFAALKSVKSEEDLEQIKMETEQDAAMAKEFVTKVLDLRHKLRELRDDLNVFFDEQHMAYEQLVSAVRSIKKSTDKKVQSSKIAGVGFALASTTAFLEHFQVISGAGACFSEKKVGLLDYVVPAAHADDSSKLGKGAMANFDKIGIVVGAGLAAAYLGFKMKFLNKILASGMSRGMVFAVLSGVALYSSKKLEKFSGFIDAQLNEVEQLKSAFSERLDMIDHAAADVVTFLAFVNSTVIPYIDKVKVEAEKSVQKHARQVKEEISEQKEALEQRLQDEALDDVKTKVEEEKERLEQELEEKKQEILNEVSTSYIPAFFDFFIPQTLASTKSHTGKNCFVYRNNFIELDSDCQCLAKKSCLRFRPQLPFKQESTISNYVTKQTGSYFRNLNSFFYGQNQQPLTYLKDKPQVLKRLHQVSDHVLKVHKQDFKKAQSLIDQQVARVIQDIPAPKNVRQLSFQLPRSKSKNQTARRQQVLKKLKRLLSSLENKSRQGTTVTAQKIKTNIVPRKSRKAISIDHIHQNKSDGLFDIISKRYQYLHLQNRI